MNGRHARGWGMSAHDRMNTTTKKTANSIVGKLTAGILAAAAVAALLPLAPSADRLGARRRRQPGGGVGPASACGAGRDGGRDRRRDGAGRAARGSGCSRTGCGPSTRSWCSRSAPTKPESRRVRREPGGGGQLAGGRCVVVATIARRRARRRRSLNRVVASFAAQSEVAGGGLARGVEPRRECWAGTASRDGRGATRCGRACWPRPCGVACSAAGRAASRRRATPTRALRATAAARRPGAVRARARRGRCRSRPGRGSRCCGARPRRRCRCTRRPPQQPRPGPSRCWGS